MSTLSSQLDELYKLEQAASKAEAAVVTKAGKIFPVGSFVCFEKFGGEIEAEVLASGFHRNFRIRNLVTGKEYRIGLYDLTREHYKGREGGA